MEATLISPDHVAALHQQGVVLSNQGRLEEALIAFERAAALQPGNSELWARCAFALQRLGRFADAFDRSNHALAIEPGHVNARINRAVTLYFLRRWSDALADFAEVLRARPGEAGARYNSSLIHLAMGDYEAGWAEYEARWVMSDVPPESIGSAQPRWQGESGGTVLLWGEQGLGDILQFCRYAPPASRLSKVILQVPQPLLRLVRNMPGVTAVIAEHSNKPLHDWQCPLMSLPRVFQTRIDTIPADMPYLHADPGLVAQWSERVSRLPGLRVGLAWAGNSRLTDAAANAADRRRSLTPAQIAPLTHVPGVTVVSLQKGATELLPPEIPICDWTDELTDLADTAALIMALDLVISVDTSVAHLAGALGRPVWIMNRFDACWRWLDGRDDSPWYPTARLFRQLVPGDWLNVIDRVAGALRNVAPVRYR